MKCPKCGKKGYISRERKGDVITEKWYCSYCFTEWPKVEEKKEEKQQELSL